MLIEIPFKDDFRDRMLSGAKTATSRTHRYGRAGDIFKIYGATFEIMSARKVDLNIIARDCYAAEGFSTPAEFIAVWQQIHPRAGYRPLDKVWYHTFRRVA